MLNYYEFINETNMSPEKAESHLELNNKGKKLPPFEDYYVQELDDKYYYVLKHINANEYDPTNNRVTELLNSLWLDTDEPRNNVLLRDVNFNPNNYYFYQLVVAERNKYKMEIHGVTLPYSDDRFDPLLTNGRKHFVVIKKKSNVPNVRLNTGNGRSASGIKSEVIIANKFGWEPDGTSISKELISNGVIAKFTDVLKTQMGILDNNEDLFDLVDTNAHLNKHDLIITSGEYIGKKIEVKKYDVADLFYRNNTSKPIMMAEQFKIATKGGLKKLVMIYNELNPDVNVQPLIGNYSEDGGVELNEFFKKDYNGEHGQLIQNIRDFYNKRIDYMFNKFRKLDLDLVMRDVFGIYFFNNEKGIDGFLIKTFNIEDHRINISYFWDKIESQWGLNRIKLLFNVNPNAYRYVWLGEEKTFAKTFEVGSRERLRELKEEDSKTEHKPIIEEVECEGEDKFGNKIVYYKTIQWDSTNGYWVGIDEEDELLQGGVHMNLGHKSKSQKQSSEI